MNVLEKIYSWGLQLDRAITPVTKLEYPVISVGNIAVGGRAKTPLVIALVKWLQARGYAPAVLTRGYGRSDAGSCVVAETSTVQETGDEPMEIFLRTRVPVLVGATRIRSAREYLVAEPPPRTIFILDDGFQHWALARDLDVVLVSEADQSDKLLPVGRLRELPSALARADLVLTLGRDCKKRVTLPTDLAANSFSAANTRAITTRAGDQSEYIAQLSEQLGFAVSHIELKDHADPDNLAEYIFDLPKDVSRLILGYKEAVKIIEPALLVKEAAVYKYTVGDRNFEITLAGLELDWNIEAFANIFERKIGGV